MPPKLNKTKTPTIYVREKDSQGTWLNPRPIKEGQGQRTSDLKPPFFIRPVIDGKQKLHRLVSETFADAKIEASRFQTGLEAHAQGLSVPEVDNANRTTLQSAIDTFLKQKSEADKRPATMTQYEHSLQQFIDFAKVKYLDEITEPVLRRYLKAMKDAGYSAKTINTRMVIIFSVLKRNKIEARIPVEDLPTVTEEPAKPFTDEQLKKLWAYLLSATTPDEPKFNGWGEDTLRYKFFLASACREQEVAFASWKDLDLTKGEYHVAQKLDVGFTPKSHENRTIPLPTPLVKALREREAWTKTLAVADGRRRWLFVNGDNKPESHFLDKFKRIALKADLNCGHCVKTRTEGRYEKQKVKVSCADKPVCEEMYLHRFRKTRATQWAEEGISVRTIQHYLGHRSLEVTQIYLGITATEKVRGKIDSSFGD